MATVFIQNTRPSKVVLTRPSPSDPFHHFSIELLPGSNVADASELALMRQNQITETAFFTSGILKLHRPPLVDKQHLLEHIAQINDKHNLLQLLMLHGHDSEIRSALTKRAHDLTVLDKQDQREYERAMREADYA